MATTPQAVSDADLLALPRDGHKRELVDGAIQVSPAGARHGAIAVALSARLLLHASARGLGQVFDSSTGFRMPSGNLRVPDVSFVAAARLPHGPLPAGFLELAPDLAVEILSPGDKQREVLDRVGEYLAAGTRLVWVIDPEAMTAAAHRSLTDVRQVSRRERLEGGDVLPGFSCAPDELVQGGGQSGPGREPQAR